MTSANSNEDFSFSGGNVDSNEDLSVNEIGGDNAELLFGKVGDNSRNVFKTGRHAKNGDVKRQRQEKELNALFNIPSGASVTNQLYNEGKNKRYLYHHSIPAQRISRFYIRLLFWVKNHNALHWV